MRLRLAKLSDIPGIQKIGKDDFRGEKWFDIPTLRCLLKRNPKTCWVVEDKGKIIGARFCQVTWRNQAWGWLVLVDPKMRHAHIGTYLFTETAKRLKKQGVTRIITDVYVENKPSIKWHKKMGYVNLGRINDWYPKGGAALIFCRSI